MKLAILTNDRKPNYIDECIRTIRAEYDGEIDLMISGGKYDYVEKYTKGFVKHKLNEEGLVENYKKACNGYAECVALGEKEGVLVVEDDTSFKRGWYKQFLVNIDTIKDKQYVMSLGDPVQGSIVDPSVQIPSLQRFLYRVNLTRNPGKIPEAVIVCWHDSHAVYYPPTLPIKDLVGYIKHFGVDKSSMHDIIVGYYLFRRVYPIYICVPKLAINIGAYNTSVGLIPNVNTDYSDWDYSDF